MNASLQFCPNETCCARGQIGVGNISIHGRKRLRYKCYTCGKTFGERKGTMFEGLRTDEETVQRVITLLAYGCPLQAIVHAFGHDERTVAAWQKCAGTHCQHIHEEIVQQGKVKSQHIQADEIRAKGRKIIVWMALAMDVATHLWLAGAVSERRDRTLIDLLLQRARVCCQFIQGLLVCTDGLATYPKSIMRAFREKVKKHSGRGRCNLWKTRNRCVRLPAIMGFPMRPFVVFFSLFAKKMLGEFFSLIHASIVHLEKPCYGLAKLLFLFGCSSLFILLALFKGVISVILLIKN